MFLYVFAEIRELLGIPIVLNAVFFLIESEILGLVWFHLVRNKKTPNTVQFRDYSYLCFSHFE